MRVDDFAFELPPDRIADRPAEPRDQARMMVVSCASGEVAHRRIADLPDHLRAGDLLVVNDTRVNPWRLCGRRAGGGRVEVLLLELHGHVGTGQIKPAAKLRPDVAIELEGGALQLLPRERLDGGRWRFELQPAAGDSRPLAAVLEEVGRAPLPPYLGRGADDDRAAIARDRAIYQTPFARHAGAIAAPTAGLHFTDGLLARLAAAGVARTEVTLHVGPGTFLPVRVDRVEDHAMHAETFVVGDVAAAAVAATRTAGGRVVAVGTTSLRALESRAAADRTVAAGSGSTALFLYPGNPPRVVDVLLTNFHLPRSTLLMLVASILGRERVLDLYRQAVAAGYRFYSFGDAMLVLP